MAKNIIQFSVFKEDGGYVASGVDFSIVTQAETLDELMKNIEEATSLHLEDENLHEQGFSSHPSVLINYELDAEVYA